MPKKRRRLSQSKVNVRRRARYAELRAERIQKSIAERMRDAHTIALQKQTIAWQAQRIAELEDRENLVKVLTGRMKVKEYLGPEEYERQIKEIAELHFREFTPEEKLAHMRAIWREVDVILELHRGRAVRNELVMWMQRNGVAPKEFWAEYRRRKGTI